MFFGMELMDNFDSRGWTRGDFLNKNGYGLYRIVKCYNISHPPNTFMYALFDDDGMLQKKRLFAGKEKDPLRGIGNVYLRLSEDKTYITGVIVEEQCVIYNDANVTNQET